MKKLAFLLLVCPLALSAQKVKYDNDTIYKDEVAYAVMIKQGPPLMPTYSIRTLTGTEIAISKFDDATKKEDGSGGYYRFTFLGSGAFGHLQPGINVGKGLAKAVVENDLIKDNTVNPDGEKRFLAAYPSQLKNTPTVIVNVNTNAPNYTTTERNRNMPIFCNGGNVTQGGVTIGTYTSTSELVGGKNITTIKFFLPSGVQVAEAKCETHTSSTATVTTMKDNRTHSVTITNSVNKEETIAKYLSENFYL